jgi:hypothetical protein
MPSTSCSSRRSARMPRLPGDQLWPAAVGLVVVGRQFQGLMGFIGFAVPITIRLVRRLRPGRY